MPAANWLATVARHCRSQGWVAKNDGSVDHICISGQRSLRALGEVKKVYENSSAGGRGAAKMGAQSALRTLRRDLIDVLSQHQDCRSDEVPAKKNPA